MCGPILLQKTTGDGRANPGAYIGGLDSAPASAVGKCPKIATDTEKIGVVPPDTGGGSCARLDSFVSFGQCISRRFSDERTVIVLHVIVLYSSISGRNEGIAPCHAIPPDFTPMIRTQDISVPVPAFLGFLLRYSISGSPSFLRFFFLDIFSYLSNSGGLYVSLHKCSIQKSAWDGYSAHSPRPRLRRAIRRPPAARSILSPIDKHGRWRYDSVDSSSVNPSP